MKVYFRKNVKIKKGFVNTALYDFDRKKVFLVNNFIGTLLVEGKLDNIDSALLKKLYLTGVLTDDAEQSEDSIEYINYELFDDKYTYKKCKLAYIEVTDVCNYNCLHCYADIKKDARQFMSAEIAKQYIEQIACEGRCDIRLTGGEPFLNADLIPIVDIIQEKVEPLTHHSLVTNGSFDIERAMYILSKGFEMQISIYGMTESKFSSFTGSRKDIYERVINNLQLLSDSEYRDQIVLLFSVNSSSYEDIELFKSYAQEKGFRYILNRPASVGRAVANWEQLKLEDKEYTEFSRSQRNTNLWFCHHLCQLHWVSIMVNGDVTPCGFLRDKDSVIGNLQKSSFEEIWNCKKYNTFRKMTSGNVNHCCDCEFRYLCTAGCCGETKAYLEDIFKPYVWCKTKPYENENYIQVADSEVYEVVKNAAGLFDFLEVGDEVC